MQKTQNKLKSFLEGKVNIDSFDNISYEEIQHLLEIIEVTLSDPVGIEYEGKSRKIIHLEYFLREKLFKGNF